MVDPQHFLLQRSLEDRRIEAEISKNAGDSRGSLLLDVAEQISCECFYNSLGQLVFAPLNQVTSDVNKPILCHYDTVNGDIGALEFSLDYSNVVNRIVIVGTSLSGGTFTHVAVNDNADSPLCYQRIGYRTGPIITDSNIYSVQLAKERAEYELRQQLILKTSLNLNVLFNPFLEVNNIVTLSDEFFDLRRERFLVQGLSCPLDYSGAMSL